MKEIKNSFTSVTHAQENLYKKLEHVSCTSDMLSCISFFLVHVSCTKQNAALFHASLYKNLCELESNSDFVQGTYTSFLHKTQVSGTSFLSVCQRYY